MTNPWQSIDLSDYEQHMRLDSVMQLQTMNAMMRTQFADHPNGTLMILGIAGGNGLEHIAPGNYERVIGVDVNADYLEATARRYPQLADTLTCIHADLTHGDEVKRLPHADTVVANLLIEYIGYDCFTHVIDHVAPTHVSCIIQINLEDGWVSDSPYLHAFDDLEQVHHLMEEPALAQAMATIGYQTTARAEQPLPNGKKLVQLDFARA